MPFTCVMRWLTVQVVVYVCVTVAYKSMSGAIMFGLLQPKRTKRELMAIAKNRRRVFMEGGAATIIQVPPQHKHCVALCRHGAHVLHAADVLAGRAIGARLGRVAHENDRQVAGATMRRSEWPASQAGI